MTLLRRFLITALVCLATCAQAQYHRPGFRPGFKFLSPAAASLNDLVVIAGQSNAVGQVSGATGLPSGWAVSSRVQMWNGSAFANYDPAAASNWGSEVNFAQNWLNDSANTGRTLYLVKSATNGTQLGAISTYGQTPGTTHTPDWYPDTASGLYSTMKTSVLAAKAALSAASLDANVKAFLWLQGESDSSQANTANAYQTNLTYFISKVRADIQSAVPFYINRMTSDPSWTYKQQVRYAEGYIPTADGQSKMIDSDSAERFAQGVGAGTVHYDAVGLNLLGQEFYQTFKSTYAQTALTMPASASASATTSTANGTVLTTVAATAGAPGASYYLTGTGSAGLTIDVQTGAISVIDSTQLVAGSYTLTVNASNGVSVASTPVALTVTTGAVVPNLMKSSEAIGFSPWTVNFATATANAAVAPDGNTTATKITQDATTGVNHSVRQVLSATGGQTYTHAAYVKKGTAGYASIAMFDGTSTYAGIFDLTAGTYLGAATGTGFVAPASATITADANGFYRAAISATIAAGATSITTQTGVKATSALTVAESGSTANNIYDWGEMVNGGSTPPAAYQKQQYTNYLLQSEAIDQSPWSLSFATVTANGAVAPDSTTTADVVAQQATTGNNHRANQVISVPGGALVTYSHYFKQNGTRYAALSVGDGITVFSGIFDLQTGTYLGDSTASGTTAPSAHSITADLQGYYRCSITFTAGATATSLTAQPGVKSTSTLSPIEAGTGATSNTINMWGAQLAIGSSMGTYTKTTTVPQ